MSRGLYIGLSSVDSHNRSNLQELTSPVIMTAATTQASSPIRIVRLAHMRYRHANLAQTQEFLEDFGMHLAYKEGNDRLYFAGDGPDPFVYVAEAVGLSLIIGLLASRSIG